MFCNEAPSSSFSQSFYVEIEIEMLFGYIALD